MYSVYLDNILQRPEDIININDEIQLTIIREDGFNSTEQVLREKTEMNLSFCGESYIYLCNLLKENRCGEVELRIEDTTCDFTITGTIKLSELESNPHQKICKTKVYDNSFSAYLREIMNVELPIFNTKTKNCEDLETVQKDIVMYTNPNNQTDKSTRIAFDALGVLRYLVSFFSDNKVGVRSTYLTNNKYAITTGFNMHNFGVGIDDIYPSVSIDKIFKEIRKKSTIYMSVEYDNGYYIRIEEESYFYNSDILFSIDDIPYGIQQTQDLDRNFASIDVGSDKTKVQDGTTVYYPQNNLTAWNKESYPFCGTCAAEKDSKLDLVNGFIIDSNMIYEALNFSDVDEYENDSEIFMFLYETISGIDTTITTLNSGTYVYNLSINNEETLNNWIDYVGKCVALQRNAKYGFLATNPNIPIITINGSGDIVAPVNCDFIRIQGTYGGAMISELACMDERYDNQNAVLTIPAIHDTPGFFDTRALTKFTCQQDGIYVFHSKSKLKCLEYPSESYVFPISIEYNVRFVVYEDDTFTVETQSSDTESLTINNPVTDITSYDFNSPPFALEVGNVVVVEISVPTISIIGTGFYYLTAIYDSSFDLISDNTTCENIGNNNQNSRPNSIVFDYQLCLDNFQKAQLNKGGVIQVGGYDYWIKELPYNAKGKSTLHLIGNDWLV
jgi:hypothetical protein